MQSSESNFERRQITFLVSGRSVELPTAADNLNRREREPTEFMVERLQRRAVEVANEIQLALHEATGDQFAVQVSFHLGSIEIQAVVSTLASSEVFQAAANLGGAAALAQTVASVVSSVFGRHLPSWMSKPMVTATPVGVATQQSPAPAAVTAIASSDHHTRDTAGIGHELRAIKWAVLGLLACAALAVGKYLFGAA
jgi:hypothetical protein